MKKFFYVCECGTTCNGTKKIAIKDEEWRHLNEIRGVKMAEQDIRSKDCMTLSKDDYTVVAETEHSVLIERL